MTMKGNHPSSRIVLSSLISGGIPISGMSEPARNVFSASTPFFALKILARRRIGEEAAPPRVSLTEPRRTYNCFPQGLLA